MNGYDCKPLLSSMATQAVSSVGLIGECPTALTYGGKLVEISSMSDTVTHLGLSTKKLFDYLLLLLTKYNSRYRRDWKNETMRFTLLDYMRVMECADDRKSKSRCLKTLLEDICKLGTIQIRQDNSDWFGLINSCSVLCAGDMAIKKELIAGEACFKVSFQKDLLLHLSKRRFIVPFAMQLFSMAGRNENAYAIAKRLILHYGINYKKHYVVSREPLSKNQERLFKKQEGLFKDQECLKVSTLLKCCPSIGSKANKEVRRTFEQALNLLSDDNNACSLLCWYYLVDGKACHPDTVSKMKLSHAQWKELVIAFRIESLQGSVVFDKSHDLDSAYELTDSMDVEHILFEGGKVNTALLQQLS